MIERIMIAGSGKMALSLGDYFQDRGFSVTWASTDEEQYRKLVSRIEKAKKRREKYFTDQASPLSAGAVLLGRDQIPVVDLIIESTSENLEKKRLVLGLCRAATADAAICCSNSSSILPQQIFPGSIGMHFFYPVALTRCVEIFWGDTCDSRVQQTVLHFCGRAECEAVILAPDSVFLTNRLLLPLQTACFESLLQGFAPSLVEDASISPLMPMGQLSMMDSIGLDLLLTAVQQYENYPSFGGTECQVMKNCLEQLVQKGKQGSKNRDGLLSGAELPWPVREKTVKQLEQLQEKLEKTCRGAIEKALTGRHIGYDELASIWERVFHCEHFSQIIQR